MTDDIVSICTSFLTGREVDCSAYSHKPEREVEKDFAFAAGQGVLPVVVAAFEKYCQDFSFLSSGLFLSYYATAMKMRQQRLARVRVMEKLSGIFLSCGLDVLYLKGETLASLYPEPSLRCSSDIDYYLFGSSRDGVEALASEGVVCRDYFHHHNQAQMSGILLEDHYDFFDRTNHRCNRILDDEMKRLASEEGKRYPFLYEGSYQMSPTMNAIFLMRHMSTHFVGETVTLRQLYDWALFLRKHSAQVDWNLVCRLYSKSGMMRFAQVVQNLLTTKLLIDVTACPIVPGQDDVTDKVWESVLYPEEPDESVKYSVRYWIRELKVFIRNRWKHRLVYPDEAYVSLFLKYSRSALSTFVHKRQS